MSWIQVLPPRKMYAPRLWHIEIYNTYTDCGHLFRYFYVEKNRPVDISETNSSKGRQRTFQDPWVSLHKTLSHTLDVRDAVWCTCFRAFQGTAHRRQRVPVGVTMGHHKKTAVPGFWLIICNEKWMFQDFWIVCLIIWKTEPISLTLTKHFWQVI